MDSNAPHDDRLLCGNRTDDGECGSEYFLLQDRMPQHEKFDLRGVIVQLKCLTTGEIRVFVDGNLRRNLGESAARCAACQSEYTSETPMIGP
jgi:hypothetical protein